MRKIAVILAVVVAVVMATGCSHTVEGNAREESYPLPAEFPDMTGYTAVGEDAPFWLASGRSIGWHFTGPRGLDCRIDLYKYGRAKCAGSLPGVGPGARELNVTEETPIALMSEGRETPASQLPPALPPRHLIRDANSGVECGLDDAGTLGCQVQGHGFVVTPTKAILF